MLLENVVLCYIPMEIPYWVITFIRIRRIYGMLRSEKREFLYYIKSYDVSIMVFLLRSHFALRLGHIKPLLTVELLAMYYSNS